LPPMYALRPAVARPRSVPAVAALSDADLVGAIKQGSEPHFNELYQRYFQRVYNFTFLRVRNHADAEEIVQETFTAVFRCVDAFRGQSSLLSWIYGIAKNTANGHLRRARTRELGMERAHPESLGRSPGIDSCTPEEHLSLRRYAEAIDQRLREGSDWQAEVFVLRHLENLSIQQIAQRTARSSDAIRSSLYRMKRLFVEASQGDPLTVGP